MITDTLLLKMGAPTHLLSPEAKWDVTVVLSPAGGNEQVIKFKSGDLFDHVDFSANESWVVKAFAGPEIKHRPQIDTLPSILDVEVKATLDVFGDGRRAITKIEKESFYNPFRGDDGGLFKTARG